MTKAEQKVYYGISPLKSVGRHADVLKQHLPNSLQSFIRLKSGFANTVWERELSSDPVCVAVDESASLTGQPET